MPEYTIMNPATPKAATPSIPGLVNRAMPGSVALESTLLLHGVPPESARPLAEELSQIVRARGAHPALVAVVGGIPTVGVSNDELDLLLSAERVPKANSSNVGALMHRKSHAATTVSTTMEFAAAAGVRVFATGGLGGAHKGFGESWDVSGDLAAIARFPVAVFASGTKSILDVVSTREMLETLGVPVVGFRTDRFPAFYLRESGAGVDATFEDPDDLARFVGAELSRTGRGIVIANPIPIESELDRGSWDRWLSQAQGELAGASGRDITPRLLASLHRLSSGATLRANLALVKSNALLAAEVARELAAANV